MAEWRRLKFALPAGGRTMQSHNTLYLNPPIKGVRISISVYMEGFRRLSPQAFKPRGLVLVYYRYFTCIGPGGIIHRGFSFVSQIEPNREL